MKDHLKNECPLNEVSCSFAYAGCEVKLPRKDMLGHTNDISVHFPLLASFTREIEQKQRATEGQYNALVEKFKATEKQYQVVVEKQRATEKQYEVLEEKLKATERKVAVLEDTHQMKSALGKFPIDFQVTFGNKEIYLPPFFTHPHGYRMCINVCPNGYDDEEDTYVSVFAYLMRGPFDNQLKWPFGGKITVQILNQAGDHDHVEKKINFNYVDDEYARRVVTGKERSENGWGEPEFLAHAALAYSHFKKTQYLKNNIIIVRVVTVTLWLNYCLTNFMQLLESQLL